MDLLRKGNMRIFIHPHHISRDKNGNIKHEYGDSESYPHVHVCDDDNVSNSFSIDTGELLQKDSGKTINRRAYEWFKEVYPSNRYAWKIVWDKSGCDWCFDLNLDIENCKKMKKVMK